VRDMTFRANFILDALTSMVWMLMNLGFYVLIFQYTNSIGKDTGWGQYEFFVFLATTMFINSIMQTFFMPNAAEFSELIRTGNLDFALLKPIDTQFLISLNKTKWSSLSNFFLAGLLLVYSVWHLMQEKTGFELTPTVVLLYPFYIACGVTILYSLMIALAATSIWLGRNQSLYNFWFYITNFSRYPMEIYNKGIGVVLFGLFTFVIPVLVVVNVPARILAQPLEPRAEWEWPLFGFAIFATVFSLVVSRWVFRRALLSYRSASS
jgi:ABC-2 type transport system permease protein